MQTAQATSPDRLETQLPSNQSIIEDSVKIFQKYLVSEWTRKKTPYGLDGALQKVAGPESDVTDRTFLNAGSAAWIAYFLATTGEGHYEGRLAQFQTIAALKQLSVEEQTLVAKRVADTVPHETVRDAIAKMRQESKRRRLLSPTSEQESPEEPIPTCSMSSMQQNTPSGLSSIQNNNDLSPGPQKQILSHASVQGIADVFPSDYMSGAIRRDPIKTGGHWTAATTMTFPYLGKVDCLMSVAIKETKVGYIAMALFNVCVEVESAIQARQLVLHHGVILIPNPEFTLQGVRLEAAKELLGPEICEAIKASRVYQEELQQGIRATRCVSMIISSNPNAAAILNLNLGLKEGSRVRDKLYQRSEDEDNQSN